LRRKNGQKPKASRWPAYTLQLTGRGETIPRDGVSKPGAGQCGKTRGKNGAAICREAFNDAPSYRIAETPFGWEVEREVPWWAPALIGTCSTKQSRRTKRDISAIRAAILDVIEDDPPMTVRQVFYQLVARGVIDASLVARLRSVIAPADGSPGMADDAHAPFHAAD